MAMVPLGVFSVGLCRASAEEGSNGIGAGRHFGVELQLRGVCEVAALGTKGLPPTSAARCWAVSVGTCQVLLKCMFGSRPKAQLTGWDSCWVRAWNGIWEWQQPVKHCTRDGCCRWIPQTPLCEDSGRALHSAVSLERPGFC